METAVSTAGRSCPRCTMVHEETFAFCPTTGEPLGDAHVPSVGGKVEGRYLLEQLIRQDDLYRVYRGRDLQNSAPVALWFLAEAAQAPDALQEQFFDALRIRQEKNVIPYSEPIIAIGQNDAFGPYAVCPALEGETLSTYVDERGVLSPEQAKAAFDQLILAVTSLADAGLPGECPHPSRIFMDAGTEKIWLLGAGLPNPTATSAGNAFQQKDEKRRFQEQAASLGECLLWMLTGQSPSGDANLQSLEGLPRGVVAFLRCCLGKPVGYTNLKELGQAWRGAFLETSGQTLALPVLAEVSPIQLKAEKRHTNGAGGVVAPAVLSADGEADALPDPLDDEIEESFWSGDLVSNPGYDWSQPRGSRKGIMLGAGIGGVLLFLGFGYLVANRDTDSASKNIAGEKRRGEAPLKRAAGHGAAAGQLERAEAAPALDVPPSPGLPGSSSPSPLGASDQAPGIAPAPTTEQALPAGPAGLPGEIEQPSAPAPGPSEVSAAAAGLKPFPAKPTPSAIPEDIDSTAARAGDPALPSGPRVPAWVKDTGSEDLEEAGSEHKAIGPKAIAQDRDRPDIRAASKVPAAKPPAVRLSTSTKTTTATKGSTSNGGVKEAAKEPKSLKPSTSGATGSSTGTTPPGAVKSKRIIEENPY